MKVRSVKVITLKVNGRSYEFDVGEGRGEMPESETLVHTLRDRLGLTGVKLGCDQGACGACTVIMNGKPVTSCMMLTMDCDGAEITTIEGLADAATGKLSGLQQALKPQFVPRQHAAARFFPRVFRKGTDLLSSAAETDAVPHGSLVFWQRQRHIWLMSFVFLHTYLRRCNGMRILYK